MGKLEDLEKLQKLKESGVITQEEFDMEKAKILNDSSNGNVSNATKSNMLEIRGDFPLVESKIPLELLEGEKVIVQHVAVICEGAAVNGLITLTNKRILFNKATGKTAMTTGLLGVAMSARKKDQRIEFSQIRSIEPKKYMAGSAGIELITNDGYTHKFALQSLNAFSKKPNETRDMIVELVKKAMNS